MCTTECSLLKDCPLMHKTEGCLAKMVGAPCSKQIALNKVQRPL